MLNFKANSKSHPVSIMMKLPFHLYNLPCYIEGEHIWSYISRLADANGFSSPEAFLNKIYSYFSYAQWKMFMTWGYEIERPFMTNLISIENMEHWIVSGTLYRALLPFHSRWEQDNRIRKHAEEYILKSSTLLVMKKTYIDQLVICSACFDEEHSNRTEHLHLVHQMPGITVCPYHGTPLIKNNLMTIPNENSLRYAEFCNGLVENPINATLQNTLTTIQHRVLELYPCMSKTKLFSTMEKDPRFKEHKDVISYIENIFAGYYKDFHQLPYEITIRCLSLLFDNYEDFRSSLYDEFDLEPNFMAAIKHKYELVSKYTNTFVIVRCLVCGTIFPTTPLSMIMKRGCPICNQNTPDNVIFEAMFNAVSKGTNWTIKSEFKNISANMVFEDKETGKTETTTPALKLYDIMTSKWKKTSSQIAMETFVENKINEMTLYEMEEKLNEASNGTFRLEIQETPKRFIATNGEKQIVDTGFTELCQRVHIYVDQENRKYMLEKIHKNMDDALVLKQGKILFTSDICPDPTFAPLARQILKDECNNNTISRFEKSTYFVGFGEHDTEEIIRRKFFDRYGEYVGVPIRNTLLSFLRTSKINLDMPYFVVHSDSPDIRPTYVNRKVGDCRIRLEYVHVEFNEQNWLRYALIYTLQDFPYLRQINNKDRCFIADLCRHANVGAEDVEEHYANRGKSYMNTIRNILKEVSNGESDI